MQLFNCREKIRLNQLSKMRYYNLDGTYEEFPLDNKFGWSFENIMIDEALPAFETNNRQIRDVSREERFACRTLKNNFNQNSISSNAESKTSDLETSSESCLEESHDELDYTNPKPIAVTEITTDIKEETPTHLPVHSETVEGARCRSCRLTQYVEKCGTSPQEMQMALLYPVNPESKALLSVVSFSKYKALNEKETNEKIFQNLNFKTTKSNQLIDDNSPFRNGTSKENKGPNLNFILTDSEAGDSDKQLASEIRNYHATKEDHMLSLMMELVITDMDSSVEDMSELNNLVNDIDNSAATVLDTSDLGTSIHSSILSKDGGSCRDKAFKKSYEDIENRSSILNSIGLSDEIDRRIEYFVCEKTELHQQIIDVKRGFEENGRKLDLLIRAATSFEHELREKNFLDNLIYLLQGKLDKVKNRKLPFRVFQKPLSSDETQINFVI